MLWSGSGTLRAGSVAENGQCRASERAVCRLCRTLGKIRAGSAPNSTGQCRGPAQRIRQGLQQNHEIFDGPIEADETRVGGLDKWRHDDKKGLYPKAIVAGVRDRATGQVRAQVVENVEAKTLQPFVNRFREPSTPVYTDDLVSYHTLGNQHSVNHSAGEYVRYTRSGAIHTNGVEGFWAYLKRGIRGTYVGVSGHHLHRYVNEFATRQNRRNLPTLAKMLLIIQGMDNRVLRYQDLIAA